MKKIISVLLLAFVLLSCAACQIQEDEPEKSETEKPTVDYHPAPENMTVSADEQQKGYRLYQGFFYYEGGAYYFYDTTEQNLYWIPLTIFVPDDFYDGCSTGDTVKIKGIEQYRTGSGYSLDSSQISVVREGEASDIPANVMSMFQEKDAPNHEN